MIFEIEEIVEQRAGQTVENIRSDSDVDIVQIERCSHSSMPEVSHFGDVLRPGGGDDRLGIVANEISQPEIRARIDGVRVQLRTRRSIGVASGQLDQSLQVRVALHPARVDRGIFVLQEFQLHAETDVQVGVVEIRRNLEDVLQTWGDGDELLQQQGDVLHAQCFQHFLDLLQILVQINEQIFQIVRGGVPRSRRLIEGLRPEVHQWDRRFHLISIVKVLDGVHRQGQMFRVDRARGSTVHVHFQQDTDDPPREKRETEVSNPSFARSDWPGGEHIVVEDVDEFVVSKISDGCFAEEIDANLRTIETESLLPLRELVARGFENLLSGDVLN